MAPGKPAYHTSDPIFEDVVLEDASAATDEREVGVVLVGQADSSRVGLVDNLSAGEVRLAGVVLGLESGIFVVVAVGVLSGGAVVGPAILRSAGREVRLTVNAL